MKALASVKAIQKHFNCERRMAREVYYALHASEILRDQPFRKIPFGEVVHYILECISKFIGAHGVESIETYAPNLRNLYFGGLFDGKATVALYVNTGDTYSSTVLYDVEKSSFILTTYGDWVETSERTGRYKFE